ncbi:MAG: hypothetical protein COA78_17115 [Blastopirellula sp.]|nr:MAG: hypothetical protein COA78_17115 [Blastopirellula sp.]
MLEEVKVKITRKADRKYWVAYYVDPLNGKQVAKSTREEKRRDAERWAAKWESELQEGRYKPASKILWAEFQERFTDEHLSGLAERTQTSYQLAFSTVDKYLSPKRLSDITTARVSAMQSKMRANKLAEDTIANYSRHLKAALNWAVDMQIMNEAPKIKMPKRVKGAKSMKGRPIFLEEFERIIAKIPSEVGLEAAPSWEFYLWGLWYSGLRFTESLNLNWDGNQGIIVDFSGKYPMMVIPADSQKSHKDELLVITPDFAELLQSVPVEERTGKVFKTFNKLMRPIKCTDRINKIICACGRLAGVKVSDKNGKVKFASAHDFRRSYGLRWAKLVEAPVLMTMMRHASITTTLKYYVGNDAETMADVIWKHKFVDTSLDTSPKQSFSQEVE